MWNPVKIKKTTKYGSKKWKHLTILVFEFEEQESIYLSSTERKECGTKGEEVRVDPIIGAGPSEILRPQQLKGQLFEEFTEIDRVNERRFVGDSIPGRRRGSRPTRNHGARRPQPHAASLRIKQLVNSNQKWLSMWSKDRWTQSYSEPFVLRKPEKYLRNWLKFSRVRQFWSSDLMRSKGCRTQSRALRTQKTWDLSAKPAKIKLSPSILMTPSTDVKFQGKKVKKRLNSIM